MEDRQAKGRHDSWNPAEARFNVEDDTAVFGVMPSVDGMVSVRVWRGSSEAGAATLPYFSGVLMSAHGMAVVRDPNDYVSLTFWLEPGPNPFYVLTDSVEFPESVDIVFTD
ncbi:hypothetical protein LFM09_01435 [Lentzea alba]|uniref:hypothetical protein n=1 Tax=Lentzea alba TaxID=2714351 RepID=UPI0039BFE364